MKYIVSHLLTLILLFSISPLATAQEPLPSPITLEGKVTHIIEEKTITPEYGTEEQLYQKLELLITSEAMKGETVSIENGIIPLSNLQQYNLNDHVVITGSRGTDGNSFFTITDYVRRDSLFLLFIIFSILVAIIGRRRGFTSLLGMAASFYFIFKLILPNILNGSDPIIVTIIGALFIIPITFFLSHGFNNKTIIAVQATIISLIITGILASLFIQSAKLTGFASEEAAFLQTAVGDVINIKGLLLAGIIIGVLGVLDDITVSQSAIVFQLKKANPKLMPKELYSLAMDVGQDHISSMVNTLILVYTGAALPLLLLFINNPHPFSEVINYEIIADEVVRTLVGSIGLILAVPITTIIAVLHFQNQKT